MKYLTSMKGIEKGTKLKVREDLKKGVYGKERATSKMVRLAGTTVIVDYVSSFDTFCIKDSIYYWTPEMFECIVEDNEYQYITPEQFIEAQEVLCDEWKLKVLEWVMESPTSLPGFTKKQIGLMRTFATTSSQREMISRLFPTEDDLVTLVAKACIKCGSKASCDFLLSRLKYEDNNILFTSSMANGDYTKGIYVLLSKVDDYSCKSAYTRPGFNDAWFNIHVRDEVEFKKFLQNLLEE